MQYLKPGAVEHPIFKGYYRHEETEMYLNRMGRIIDNVRMCSVLLRVPKNPMGYMRFYIPSLGVDMTHHRAVAELFVEKKDVKHNLVNHLDGIKVHNHADNLEWTDHTGNLVHAFETGLRDDCKKIITKDIVTGEVIEYLGLNALARCLNVNSAKISIYMSSARKAPFENRLAIIWGGESWPNFTADDVYTHRNGLPKTIIAIYEDGKRLLFASAGIAAEYLGVKVHNIHSYLNKPARAFYGNGYFLKYAYEYTRDPLDKLEMIDKKRERNITNFVRKPHRVLVTDMTTNESKEWDSLELFGSTIDVKRSTIRKAVYLKGQYKQYKIEYLK